MKYNPKHHITIKELSGMYDMSIDALNNHLRHTKPAGKEWLASVGTVARFYDSDFIVAFLNKRFGISVDVPNQQEPAQLVKPRMPKPFRPYRPTPHPRAADIDAAQPSMICGVRSVGNGGDAGYWTR